MKEVSLTKDEIELIHNQMYELLKENYNDYNDPKIDFPSLLARLKDAYIWGRKND